MLTLAEWNGYQLNFWDYSTFLNSPLSYPCYLSQFEEKFEEIHGIEPTPNYPSTSSFVENLATTMVSGESRGKVIEMQGEEAHRMCSDLNTSQDFVSGIMKIVPSDVDVSLSSCLCHYASNELISHFECIYFSFSNFFVSE